MRKITLVCLAASVLAACGDGSTEPFDSDSEACLPASGGEGWRFTPLGAGTKPALHVTPEGAVHAAFMEEAQPGWVRYVRLDPGTEEASTPETVAEGYFYGPIDLLLDAADRPLVLYHDHDREDQVLAQRGGDASWSLHPMGASGHDGWYNRGVRSADGVVHTATYDPSGFGGRGVIYGIWDGTAWSDAVAAAGSFDYAGGMAIAGAAGGGLHIAYFDDGAGEGRLLTREPGGDWTQTTPEARGGRLEVGRFPDLVVGSDGSTIHMVGLARDDAQSGTIRYATGSPGALEIRDIFDVTAITIGFLGARDPATIAIYADGRPVVAVQTLVDTVVLRIDDDEVVELARFAPPLGTTLGQQTDVAIEGSGAVHVVWWQSGAEPGLVCHAVQE